jgi:single-stranded-DNA-specific exonuclease
MPTHTDRVVDWVEPGAIPGGSAWRSLHPHPLVAALLYRKGFRSASEAAAFLVPGDSQLPDPDQIPNMPAAAARIATALASGEIIGVFGDYDVDGVTSTAILGTALRRATGDDQRVVLLLPERNDGYGLNDAAIEQFRHRGVSVVIAVDCGSSDHEHARQILEAGMDLVIIDHHHMADAGPAGAMTVSPRLIESGDLQDLTAAGLAWLFVRALATTSEGASAASGPMAKEYLDLAALGTVADVAPLTGSNRPIVRSGLQLIRSGTRPGLAALLQSASQERSTATARTISHAMAPRLNAAGRLSTPRLALEVLMAPDLRSAVAPARALEDVNARRRQRSQEVSREAWDLIARQPGWREKPVIAAASDTWEAGIVGAVASRLAEDLRRPVFLFHRANGVLSGSARSVEGLDLMASLAGIDPLLERYGGHKLAAGISIREEHLPALESHLTGILLASGITIPAPKLLKIAANLPPGLATVETAVALQELEPFGRGNEEPLLRLAGANLIQYSTMGAGKDHLKVVVEAGGNRLDAILWNGAYRSRELMGQRSVDLLGRLEINTWNGRQRVQLILEDFVAK